MAVVAGTFTVSGAIRVWVNADYGTNYPSSRAQEYRIIVRLEGPSGWAFERELIAHGVQPKFSPVGRLDFSVSGLHMAIDDTVRMTLLTARWGDSPQHGREDWATVQAEVLDLKLCAHDLQPPDPPPSPPSPPPSPPPPSPPPSPPPP